MLELIRMTERWQIADRYIGEVSTTAKCRWSIGQRKAISAETHLERLSTVSRPSVVRLSSESRPTIDRYIDRVSTAISTDGSVDTTYSKHDPPCIEIADSNNAFKKLDFACGGYDSVRDWNSFASFPKFSHFWNVLSSNARHHISPTGLTFAIGSHFFAAAS